MKLFLASQSPRRREILQQLGVPFEVVAGAVDETPLPAEAPEAYVLRLAEAKARAGVEGLAAAGPTLGADTIVCLDGQLLGKPQSAEQGSEMLLSLAGRTHQVVSAIALCDGTRCESAVSTTEVDFGPISLAEAERYWATGEPQDKAGGYAIQGLGAVFVQAIRGSYSGVVGLPVEVLVPLLQQFSIPYWSVSE